MTPQAATAAERVLRLTAGAGKRQPQGRGVEVSGTVEDLARWLNEREPEGLNTWWSVHTFQGDYCEAKRWTGAEGVAVDVDYCGWAADDPRHATGNGKVSHDHTSAPPDELTARLEAAIRGGEVPGNLYHRTAHGFRFVFLFDGPCQDANEYTKRARTAHDLVRQALADLEIAGCPGVHVDELLDLRRVFWAPRGWCLGPDDAREERERDATVLVMRREAYVAEALHPAPAPAVPPREPALAARNGAAKRATDNLELAVERYNRDHARELPRNSGACPMCEKPGRFGSLPDAPGRWSCWGASHPEVGCRPSTSGNPWTGDVLDLDAFKWYSRTGKDHQRARAELLRAEGYLATPKAGADIDDDDAEPSPFRGDQDENAAAEALPCLPDLIPGGRLLDTDYPPVEYAVDPILPLRELAEWVGKHGIFKSTLALAAALAVATGRRFGGMPVRKGKAVFITAEDGERTIALRVRAWLDSIPVGAERAAATKAYRENFYFLAREHVRGLALTLVEDGEPAARAGVVARLTKLVLGAVLVFLETAARLAEGNENENRVQAAFALALEEIAIDSGSALGIVRHVGKHDGRADTTDSYAGRGGGALSDAARSVVNFTRPGSKGEEPDPFAPITMTHAKATLSRPAQKILWIPVETSSGGVYLRALSDDEELRANAQKLLAAMPPEGFTASELHKRPPTGLSRAAAKAALEFLVETKRVVPTDDKRGQNRQTVTVYRAVPGASP